MKGLKSILTLELPARGNSLACRRMVAGTEREDHDLPHSVIIEAFRAC